MAERSERLRIRGYSELVAVVPHLVGFEVTESAVRVPLGGRGPVVRLDHPHQDADVLEAARVLTGPYMHAYGDVALLSFTSDLQAAEKLAYAVNGILGGEMAVAPVLRVDAGQWTDLATGATGPVKASARARVAAELVFAGKRAPAGSREELAADLVGPPEERARIAKLLPGARDHAAALRRGDLTREAVWVASTVADFCTHGKRLDDQAAARLLADVDVVVLRDVAWSTMTQQGAAQHEALWRDLTRRAPEDARTPAACLLAFSAWLGGNGARAWVALDLVPDPNAYTMARLLERTLENAVPPDAWTATPASLAGSGAPALGGIAALQQGALREPVARPRAGGPLDTPGQDRPAAPDR